MQSEDPWSAVAFASRRSPPANSAGPPPASARTDVTVELWRHGSATQMVASDTRGCSNATLDGREGFVGPPFAHHKRWATVPIQPAMPQISSRDDSLDDTRESKSFRLASASTGSI